MPTCAHTHSTHTYTFLRLHSLSLSFQFNETGRGSDCSQAIMLVTDGAVDTYDTIFAKYNWPERKVAYKKHKCAHHIIS